MLIALWCAHPIKSTEGGVCYVTTRDVQACRDRVIQCTSEKKNEEQMLKCFREEKLK